MYQGPHQNQNSYFSKKLQCAGHTGEDKKLQRILTGKPLRKWTLSGRRRWEDNDKIQPKEIHWDMDATSS
jgi:hypothetical protein